MWIYNQENGRPYPRKPRDLLGKTARETLKPITPIKEQLKP